MASPILNIAATAGAAATISPKGTLSRLGLRTPSARDVITDKRIPGSANNKFLQRFGMETEEDTIKIINEAERKSSRKKGLGFVFKLLLKTLLDISELRREYGRRNYWSKNRELEEFMDDLMTLKKREDKLIYILAYSSVLTDDGASQSMRNMLEQIRSTWGLYQHEIAEVPDWKLIYNRRRQRQRYNRRSAIHFFDDNLDDKIDLLFEYIKIVENKEKTRNRRMARMVARHAASKYNLDPTLLPYEKAGSNNAVGPLAHIGSFIPDTAEHKQKTIDERERVEETGGESKSGGRMRKRKTRKSRRKHTKKRRKSKRKKTRKKRRKRKTKRRR